MSGSSSSSGRARGERLASPKSVAALRTVPWLCETITSRVVRHAVHPAGRHLAEQRAVAAQHPLARRHDPRLAHPQVRGDVVGDVQHDPQALERCRVGAERPARARRRGTARPRRACSPPGRSRRPAAPRSPSPACRPRATSPTRPPRPRPRRASASRPVTELPITLSALLIRLALALARRPPVAAPLQARHPDREDERHHGHQQQQPHQDARHQQGGRQRSEPPREQGEGPVGRRAVRDRSTLRQPEVARLARVEHHLVAGGGGPRVRRPQAVEGRRAAPGRVVGHLEGDRAEGGEQGGAHQRDARAARPPASPAR